MSISELEFKLLNDYLYAACGMNVPWEKRYLFETRLEGLLRELGVRSFAGLYARLAEQPSPDLRARVIEAMTTHETSFFRDWHPFEALRKAVLPTQAAAKARFAPLVGQRIRVLSAGCSTGQEPYSIAMTLLDWLGGQSAFGQNDISVVGMDISRPAIETARRGVYGRDEVVRHTPASFLESYFEKHAEGWRVRDHVRQLVSLQQTNINEPMNQSGFFDVIFCRNVAIYFALPARKALLQRLHDLLPPGGVLFIGAAESLLQLSDRFEMAHCGPTTYYTKRG